MKSIAAAVFLIAAFRNYAWGVFPPEMRGSASKALGALALLGMMLITYQLKPSKLLAVVMIWWAWEETQTVVCSVAYMIDPWAVPVGQSICSARIGFDLGAIGLVVIALLAREFLKPVRGDTDINGPESRK